jgi:hypothetical protein
MDFKRLRMSGFNGYLSKYRVQKRELLVAEPQFDLEGVLQHYVQHRTLGNYDGELPIAHMTKSKLYDLIGLLDILLYKSDETSWM